MIIFSYLAFYPCALWADLSFQHPGTNGELCPLEPPHFVNSLYTLLLWASSWQSSFLHLLPGNPLCLVHALLEVSRHRESRSPHQHPDTPHSRERGRASVIGNNLSQSLLHYKDCFYILSPLQLCLVKGQEKKISQTMIVTARSWLLLSDNCWLPVFSAKPHCIMAVYLLL